MNKKRVVRILICICLFYILLAVVLYAVENVNGTGSNGIKSLGDAVWYLLATLTTVGYGDVTPVTGLGKVIGAFAMISSAGLLTFLLGLLFSVLFGKLVPSFKLWLFRNRDWYIFSKFDEVTQTLAAELSKDDRKPAFIFSGNTEAQTQLSRDAVRHQLIIDSAPEEIIRRQNENRCSHVFYMGENGWENYLAGHRFLEKNGRNNIKLYCRTDYTPDEIPERMSLFCYSDCLARFYWNEYPVGKKENVFVIIGDGKAAEKIFERSLNINVFPRNRYIEYHLFGDWKKFRMDHYMLDNEETRRLTGSDEDVIVYEDKPWNFSQELLRRASRIILCGDDESENLSGALELKKYFATNAKIDVYATKFHERFRCFGSGNDILTRQIIMHEQLNQTARKLNDLYCKKNGNGKKWENLMEFHRQSNIASADHLLTKIRLLLSDETVTDVTPEICREAYNVYTSLNREEKEKYRWLEHKRWVRFHLLNNWSYSETRDNSMRKHNLLVSYDQLTDEEKALDDSAWTVLGEM